MKLCALVARHNRPPYQNEDGTYPALLLPIHLGIRNFLSNPPYAARAYAYVVPHNMDALIFGLALQKFYNRAAAPYTVDATYSVLVPKYFTAYPSEDGVLSE